MLDPCKLSVYQIVESFPEECKELIPKQLKKLRKDLQPWLNAAKHIDNQPWPNDWKVLAMAHLDGMKPKTKFEQYQEVMAIAKIMNAPKFDGQITNLDIQLAKQVPIETLYDGWERKRKHKTGFMARCPLGTHIDEHPSFGVKNNVFKCFSCQISGSGIDLVMKIQGKSFVEAVKFIRKI